MRKLLLLFAGTIFVFSGFIYYSQTSQNPIILSIYDENISVFQKFAPIFSTNEKKRAFDKVLAEVNDKKGTYGIYIKDLQDGKTYMHNESELFYGASLFKVPIGAAVLKEIQDDALQADEKITYLEKDYFGGTGTIYYSKFGTKFSVEYLVGRLLKDSDNVAQAMLTRIVPPSKIGEAFALITIKNYFFKNNTVTPEQLGNFFENLISGDYLTQTNKTILLNIMSQTSFDDRVHAGLSEGVKFSHKIGNWPETAAWHDCGVVSKDDQKVIACVMSRNTTFEEFLNVSKKVGKFVSLLL